MSPRGKGRPRGPPTTHIRITKDTQAKLTSYAKTQKVTVDKAVKKLLDKK